MTLDHPDEISSLAIAKCRRGGAFGLGSFARHSSLVTRHCSHERLFYPFGEQWTGSDLYSLGMHQTFGQLPDYDNDSNSDLYNTLNRHYTPMGRWLSPDPAGINAVKLDDPQTWNMYAYIRNNPTTNVDPAGELYCSPADENGTMDCVLDQEYFQNPDKYGGYTYYQSDYPQEQNEPNGQQEAGAQSPDLDPIDLGLLLYGGITLARGIADVGADVVSVIRGAFRSETPVIQTLGVADLWASADEVVNRAVATIGNQSMKVANKEVAEAAAEKFVGPGKLPALDRNTGQIVGWKSADGTKVAIGPHMDAEGVHYNLKNLSTGGNLHVRW
jgi:RHS repeat-associated protein